MVANSVYYEHVLSENYTDYHQFSWVKISPRITYKSFLRTRFVPYSFFFLLVSFNVWLLAQNQKIVYPFELFASLISIIIAAIAIMSIIDFQITKNLPKKIKSYKIDRNGIHINNQVVPYAKLQKTRIIDKSLDTNEMFFVIPKKPLGMLKLEFNQVIEKDKITKALEHYAKNS